MSRLRRNQPDGAAVAHAVRRIGFVLLAAASLGAAAQSRAAETSAPPAGAASGAAMDMPLKVPEDVGRAIAAGERAAGLRQLAEAEEQFRLALETIERSDGPEHPAAVSLARMLGVILVEQNKYVEGETLLRRAMQGFRKDAERRAPAEPPLAMRRQHAATAVEFGLAFYGQKRHAEAEAALRQALQLLDRLPDADDHAVQRARLFLGDSLAKLGRPAEAVPLLQAALDGIELSRGPEHIEVGLALWRLGDALAADQAYVQADSMLRRSLSIYDAQAATRQGQSVDVAASLGRVLLAQGRPADAEPLLRRVLDFAAARVGGVQIHTQNAARELAQSLRRQGRNDEARELLRRHGVDPDSGKAAAGVRPDTMMAATEAAAYRYFEGLPADARAELGRGGNAHGERRYVESESAYRRALQLAERAVGAQDPAKSLVEVYLGDALIEQHRYADAEAYLRGALAAQQSVLARQAPKPSVGDRLLLVRTWLRLGLSLYGQRKRTEAVSSFRQGLDLADEIGRDDPGTAASRMYLAEALLGVGAFVQAEDQFRRAATTYADYRISEDMDGYRRALVGIARSVFERRRYVDAVPLLERAVRLCERSPELGPAHSATIGLLWSLGVSLHHSSRLAEAESVFRRGLAAADKGLGPEHPDMADLAKWLGINLRAQERPAEAEPNFRRALSIYRKVAPRKAVTADAAVQYAAVLEKLDRQEEAVRAYHEGVEILESLGASERKDLAAALRGLVRALRATGRVAEAHAAEQKLHGVERDTSKPS